MAKFKVGDYVHIKGAGNDSRIYEIDKVEYEGSDGKPAYHVKNFPYAWFSERVVFANSPTSTNPVVQNALMARNSWNDGDEFDRIFAYFEENNLQRMRQAVKPSSFYDELGEVPNITTYITGYGLKVKIKTKTKAFPRSVVDTIINRLKQAAKIPNGKLEEVHTSNGGRWIECLIVPIFDD